MRDYHDRIAAAQMHEHQPPLAVVLAAELASVAANQRQRLDIDEETLSRSLYTAGQPDPDLLIRTSGEQRVSNFLLWQIAYSEIHVTPVLWPDFRRNHLLEAILDYQGRERRFGGIDAVADPVPVRPDAARA